jgi:predicted metal-dependent hydrolase
LDLDRSRRVGLLVMSGDWGVCKLKGKIRFG